MKSSRRLFVLHLVQFSWRVKNLALRSKLDILSLSSVRDDTIIPGLPSQSRAGLTSPEVGSVDNSRTQTLKKAFEVKLNVEDLKAIYFTVKVNCVLEIECIFGLKMRVTMECES